MAGSQPCSRNEEYQLIPEDFGFAGDSQQNDQAENGGEGDAPGAGQLKRLIFFYAGEQDALVEHGVERIKDLLNSGGIEEECGRGYSRGQGQCMASV